MDAADLTSGWDLLNNEFKAGGIGLDLNWDYDHNSECVHLDITYTYTPHTFESASSSPVSSSPSRCLRVRPSRSNRARKQARETARPKIGEQSGEQIRPNEAHRPHLRAVTPSCKLLGRLKRQHCGRFSKPPHSATLPPLRDDLRQFTTFG
jgi:hypothetical protein